MVNPDRQELAAGLYLIATPIGSARDVTLRALDILAAADILVAEDTRSLRRLMDIHGVALGARPLWSYHEHNGARMRPRIMEALDAGKSVVYASEAGTPMISDPGFDLGRAAVAAGFPLTAAPGPSAVITALTLAGLPTDRFLFAGFLPNAAGRRKSVLAELAAVPATLVFYDSPNRITATLRDAAEVLGGDRAAALCRELTKKFEEIRRGTLAELLAGTIETPPRGEIVLVVDRAHSEKIRKLDLDLVLKEALQEESVRDAADRVAAALNLPRREVYQRALKLAAGRRME